MKKVLGGLTILLILGLVLAGCANPADPANPATGSSSDPGIINPDVYLDVAGLPSVKVNGDTGLGGKPTNDIEDGDDVVRYGNGWRMAMKFSGNKEFPYTYEEIQKVAIRKQIPIYEWEPVYNQVEIFEQVKVYEQIPVYKKIPVFEQIPEYEQKPIYEQIPVYEEIPIYVKVPKLAWDPIYQEIPVYVQEPVYGTKPVYHQKPIWGKIPKIIEVETWVPNYGGKDTAWAGWATDDKDGTFPKNDAGFEKNGVIRTGQTAWSMAVAYEGEAKEVLLVQGQHTVVGKAIFEPVCEDQVLVTLDLGDNILDTFHLGYYCDISDFLKVGNGNLNGNKLVDGATALIPYECGKLYIGIHAEVKERLADKMEIVKKTVYVDGITGWEDNLNRPPKCYVPDYAVITGYEDSDEVDYMDYKLLYYKPVIAGYCNVKIGTMQGKCIGYLDGDETGETEDDLTKPTGEFKKGKFLGWETTEEILYMKKGCFLYYEDGDSLGFIDGDKIVGYEKGEFLYCIDGKIIGWKCEVVEMEGVLYGPAVFDLIAGQNVKAGEVNIFDNGDGTLTLTYLFYNGANPKEIHAGAWSDTAEIGNDWGNFPVNVKPVVLNEDRTYSVTLSYEAGSTVYVAAHCSF